MIHIIYIYICVFLTFLCEILPGSSDLSNETTSLRKLSRYRLGRSTESDHQTLLATWMADGCGAKFKMLRLLH